MTRGDGASNRDPRHEGDRQERGSGRQTRDNRPDGPAGSVNRAPIARDGDRDGRPGGDSAGPFGMQAKGVLSARGQENGPRGPARPRSMSEFRPRPGEAETRRGSGPSVPGRMRAGEPVESRQDGGRRLPASADPGRFDGGLRPPMLIYLPKLSSILAIVPSITENNNRPGTKDGKVLIDGA